MKKLITYATLCLIAILVMPSCKGKMGITKRHYQKGYYVSHSKANNKSFATKAQPKQVEADKMASVNVLSSKAKESALNEQVSIEPKVSIMASAFPKKGESSYTEKKVSYKNLTINPQVKELKQAILKSNSGSHEGGLSLFWIIILVLLILWLLGFLAGGLGLGGFINILLIIALILLILWLLRIV
jgi:Flp pilus assembly protein TadB